MHKAIARFEYNFTRELYRATNQLLFRIIGAMIAIVGLGVSSLVGIGFWVLQHYIAK